MLKTSTWKKNNAKWKLGPTQWNGDTRNDKYESELNFFNILISLKYNFLNIFTHFGNL